MDKETLHRYFEGKSTLEEEIQVVNWVEASESNRKDYLRERMLWDAVTLTANSKDLGVPVQKRANRTSLWRAIAVAASIALLLGISWTIWDRSANLVSQQNQTMIHFHGP